MRKMMCVLQKVIYLVLIITLLSSAVSFSAFALFNEYSGPSIISVSMNETRSKITLNFDREIEPATSSFLGKVKLGVSGKTPESLPSDTDITVSGYRMYINLTSSLNSADNFFSITKGTLINQSIDIESELFDARDPALVATNSVLVSPSAQTVTLRFKTGIKGYPNDSALKNGYITLARNGTTFNEVIPAKDITIDNSRGQITVKISDWITGSKSKIKIAAGKIKSQSTGNINISDIITPAINASSTSSSTSDSDDYDDSSYYEEELPELDYTTVSDDLRTVTIYFTEKIKNSFASGVSTSVALSFLKSNIWISRASDDNYELLSGSDSVSVGSDYIEITFDDALLNSKNYIKIEGSSLTDAYGTPITKDIITGNVTSSAPSSSSVPEFASASLIDNDEIAVYFTIPVIRNTTLTQSEFRSSIFVSRNGDSYEKLGSYDSVSFSGNSMIIHLDTPLSGTDNRVRIQPQAVISKYGYTLDSTVTTPELTYDDDYDSDYYDSLPEYERVTYDEDLQCIKIYFKDDIKFTSSSTVLNGITIARNTTSFKSLSEDDVVRISPSNVLSIALFEPLSGNRNAVRISGNTLADYDTGYVLNETITTDYISADGSSDSDYDDTDSTTYPESEVYSGDVKTSISSDLYTITLKFNEPLYNSFNSLEELKSKIQISRNGRFSSLSADDYIRINDSANELVMVLATPANEYFSQIKILSGALRNAAGNAISTTVTTLPLGEAKGVARAYLNDSFFDASLAAEISSDSVVASLSDETKLTSLNTTSELLIKLPEEKNKAILNVSKSVADTLKRYGSTLALSFGNTTYYLPASSISTLSEGDTLSITINKESAATQSLASSAAKDSFSIVTPAVNVSASIVSASGEVSRINHSVFAKKRFIAEKSTSNSVFTAVRIEPSGTVVPVPSGTDTSKGVVYITSKTLADGDYAAISANHSFVNTPSWVTTPANTLGSRLILSNASGTDLNASQAISRAETVTIMTKTLGVFCDSTGASPFFDMISTDSYFNAVMSAVSHKLISGYPDGTFKPSGTLTRAEAMTIVARAMRFMNGKSASSSSDMTAEEASSILSKFTDNKNVDSWARVDIAECVQAGVVNGDNNGRLNPKANVTRAELIQLMYNVLNKSGLL